MTTSTVSSSPLTPFGPLTPQTKRERDIERMVEQLRNSDCMTNNNNNSNSTRKRPAATLTILPGGSCNDQGSHQLYTGITIVGCNPTADLILTEPGVSNFHCCFHIDLDGAIHYIQDLDSTNYTNIISSSPHHDKDANDRLPVLDNAVDFRILPNLLYQLPDGIALRIGPLKCIYSFHPSLRLYKHLHMGPSRSTMSLLLSAGSANSLSSLNHSVAAVDLKTNSLQQLQQPQQTSKRKLTDDSDYEEDGDSGDNNDAAEERGKVITSTTTSTITPAAAANRRRTIKLASTTNTSNNNTTRGETVGEEEGDEEEEEEIPATEQQTHPFASLDVDHNDDNVLDGLQQQQLRREGEGDHHLYDASPQIIDLHHHSSTRPQQHSLVECSLVEETADDIAVSQDINMVVAQGEEEEEVRRGGDVDGGYLTTSSIIPTTPPQDVDNNNNITIDDFVMANDTTNIAAKQQASQVNNTNNHPLQNSTQTTAPLSFLAPDSQTVGVGAGDVAAVARPAATSTPLIEEGQELAISLLMSSSFKSPPPPHPLQNQQQIALTTSTSCLSAGAESVTFSQIVGHVEDTMRREFAGILGVENDEDAADRQQQQQQCKKKRNNKSNEKVEEVEVEDKMGDVLDGLNGYGYSGTVYEEREDAVVEEEKEGLQNCRTASPPPTKPVSKKKGGSDVLTVSTSQKQQKVDKKKGGTKGVAVAEVVASGGSAETETDDEYVNVAPPALPVASTTADKKKKLSKKAVAAAAAAASTAVGTSVLAPIAEVDILTTKHNETASTATANVAAGEEADAVMEEENVKPGNGNNTSTSTGIEGGGGGAKIKTVAARKGGAGVKLTKKQQKEAAAAVVAAAAAQELEVKDRMVLEEEERKKVVEVTALSSSSPAATATAAVIVKKPRGAAAAKKKKTTQLLLEEEERREAAEREAAAAAEEEERLLQQEQEAVVKASAAAETVRMMEVEETAVAAAVAEVVVKKSKAEPAKRGRKRKATTDTEVTEVVLSADAGAVEKDAMEVTDGDAVAATTTKSSKSKKGKAAEKSGKKKSEDVVDETRSGASSQRQTPLPDTDLSPNSKKKKAAPASSSSLSQLIVAEPAVSGEAAVRVSFTGLTEVDTSKDAILVENLGGELVVDDWNRCTHLITDKVRRTVKFLCALSSGKHVVSVKWLEACKKAGKFVSESKYYLKDKLAEKDYGFSLVSSMKAVRDGTRAFEGLSFYVTPSFVLGADTTKQMVESAGGYMLDALPSKNEEGFDNIKLVVLGNEDDMALCKKIAKSYNIDIHTKEFVLTGLLKQSADFESFRLF